MKKLLFLVSIVFSLSGFSQTYWKVDPQNEWTGTDAGWNALNQSNAVIAAGNVTQSNLVKSTGASSTVGITFISGWQYNATTAMQGSNLGVFSDLIENHGWYYNNGAQFRFTGLNNSKYYTIYILASSWNYEGGSTTFTAGGNTSNSTITTLNVGDKGSFPNYENDVALNKLVNISPTSGQINVTMNLTGYGAVTAIVLKEQTAFFVPTNPAAPTSGIVDDNLNTFDFTLNPTYGQLSQYEFTLDSGYTWHTLYKKPIPINNMGIKKGYVGVRVKDMNDNGVGFPLWSNADFTITSPTPSPSVITVKVVLNGTPQWTSKLVPAGLKYNKQGRFGMTMDDRGLTALDLGAYISGGTAPQNGVTYPGKTFTDGANVNAHNIGWRASLASNAYATDTTVDAALGGYSMTWTQANSLVQKNWDLLDHGAWHGIKGGGVSASIGLNTTFANAAQNRNYSFRKLFDLGTQYVMRYGVVPTNDENYHSAWEQLGYPGGSSQGTHDGYPHQFNENNVTNWLTNRSYKVHLRYFADLREAGVGTADRAQWLAAINNVTSLSNSTTHYSSEIGMHYASIDSIAVMMDYAATHFNNNIWVCGLQEFMEYFETMQQTGIKQKIIGDTLFVTLDQTFLNPEQRWRDMSFLLNSNRSISSVTVTGADDYSYNTSTGLINVYKKKTTGYEVPADGYSTGFALHGKIPLKQYDVFIDDNYDRLPEEMVDGDTTTKYSPKVSGGFMYPAPYEFVVDLQDWGAVVDSVKIRVNAGGTYTTKVILTRNDNEVEDSIGVYSQQSSNKWLTFKLKDTTQKYVASRVILRTDNYSDGFGNEIRVYGDYMPYGVEQKFTHRKTPLKYEMGANIHWWSLTNNITGLDVDAVFDKLDTVKLYSIRNYGDTWDYQNEDGSAWSFNPVQQGWREEQMEQHYKSIVPTGKFFSVMQGQPRSVLPSWNTQDTSMMIKGVITNLSDLGYGWDMYVSALWTKGYGPVGADKVMSRSWVNPISSSSSVISMSDSWQVIPRPDQLPFSLKYGIPNGHGYSVGDTVLMTTRRVSTLPITYQGNLDRQNLQTWDTLARLSYGYASRKGTNPNATLMPVTGGNVAQVANGTSDMFEIMNEPDKTWVGYDDYLNGKDLAVAWSKGYDNHKTFSTSLGMKNADTAMKFQSSGLAVNATYPMRGADYWSKVNRGSRPKTDVGVQPMTWKARTFGWVDQPYDGIQFHNYSYTGGSNQYAGNVQSGLPVELSGSLTSAKDFNLFRNKYAPWAFNDVGEWGYDRSQYSTMNAPYIDNYSAERVRAAWALRTLFVYNVNGVDYAQWYRLFHEHNGDDTTAGTQFETMSLLLDSLGNGQYIRINQTGYAFSQMDEFGGYVYDSTYNEDTTLYALRFKEPGTNNSIIPVWGVESSPNKANWKTEKAVFHERTGSYFIPIANGTQVHVRKLQPFGNTMSDSVVTISGGGYTVNYGLVPIILQIDGVEVLQANAGPDQEIATSSVLLDASGSTAAEGHTLVSYIWEKISGPGATSIPNPTNPVVTATGLEAGVYVFRVTVVQDDEQTSTDDVEVTVTTPTVPPTPTGNWLRIPRGRKLYFNQ